MSAKQMLLNAIESLPDGATWDEMTAAILAVRAQCSGAGLTAGQLAELGARIGSIPGVDPADVWAAAAEADAGRLVEHDELFARLRARK